MNIPDAMVDAEEKAWRALAGYKFWMFGYHAAQWVLLNKIDVPFGERMENPFRKLVKLAREHVAENYDGKPPPLEHPRLMSLSEVQSERENGLRVD